MLDPQIDIQPQLSSPFIGQFNPLERVLLSPSLSGVSLLDLSSSLLASSRPQFLVLAKPLRSQPLRSEWAEGSG